MTGEDVLELHIHGGPAVVKAVLDAIPKTISPTSLRSYPLRYAEPGEFTRRAFYNNRLDLTQVEALGDVLSAETEQQRRLAVRGASSGLAKEYELWRKNLILAQGELEALIDFSEDQHFDESPTTLTRSVAAQVEQLQIKLITNIKNSSRGELLRNGINIALLGAPNAGKSSLLNRIIGREAAIVSEEEGTTRDVVEAGVDLGGFFCRFGDLAGLRMVSHSSGSPKVGRIEQEGMRRAKERVIAADVVLVILSTEDLSRPNTEVLATLRSCDMTRQRIIYVINKSDLLKDHSRVEKIRSLFETQPYPGNNSSDTPVFIISCKEAQYPQERLGTNTQDPGGIETLLRGLVQVFLGMTSAVFPEGHIGSGDRSIWEQSLGANQRQRLLLQQCLQCLENFLAEVGTPLGHQPQKYIREEPEIDVVMAAESLRSAADCLAKLTGKGESGNVEEVLGVVFEKYASLLKLQYYHTKINALKLNMQILCRQITSGLLPCHLLYVATTPENAMQGKRKKDQVPIQSHISNTYMHPSHFHISHFADRLPGWLYFSNVEP